MSQKLLTEKSSLLILRLMVSIIIFTHGWHRLTSGGTEPFAEWLNAQGIPLAVVLAWFITLIEIIGAPVLALGRQVIYLCIVYIVIYLTGLFMVHLPHGWFVVGSGRNGIEYSCLLVAALVAVALPHVNKLWSK